MVAACKEPSRQLDTPIGTTAVELDSRSTTVRSRETAIGALIANAMRWSAQTEVAMTNGGGSRGGGGSLAPAIGALIANAMLWWPQTEVAMTNGGGIRGGAGSIRPARPSRGATVLAKLPFGNTRAHAQASVLLADRAHDARSRAAVARGALHLLQDRLVVRGNRRH